MGAVSDQHDLQTETMWKYFDMLPLRSRDNIVSLGEGDSPIIELPDLSPRLNGARCFLLLDSHRNPTGTFKDREGSLIISRCLEAGLDRLVFYSTGNTGRSYTHYAAQRGLTTYCFLPSQCRYKNTDSIDKNDNNYFIYVDDNYPAVGPYARRFAEVNGLNAVAPIDDRAAAYQSVAYEQHEKLPGCTYYVQTIASGLGPIGFLRGHEQLVRAGRERPEEVPRIIGVQSSETNLMTIAFNRGDPEIRPDDLAGSSTSVSYEPTLHSTNPQRNYPALRACLKQTNGLLIDVRAAEVEADRPAILQALERQGLTLRTDLEKSILIEFSGLLGLAEREQFSRDDSLLVMGCGRGIDESTTLLQPDAVIDPARDDPARLFESLSG
jgi:threonine synthase